MNKECTWTDDVCITTSRFWSLEPWEQKAMSRYLKQKKLTRVGRVEASGCIPVSSRDSKENFFFVLLVLLSSKSIYYFFCLKEKWIFVSPKPLAAQHLQILNIQ